MERATTAGTTYCVNVKTAPVAVYAVLPNTDPEERELLRIFTEAGQQYFTAQSGKTVLEGGTVGLVTETFNAAPATVVGGGGASPSPLDPEKPLKHGHIYALTVTEATDLSALTVEDDATAEIWLSYSAGSVTWPSAWLWGTDTFDSASPEATPDFTQGEFFCLVVRHYAALNVTLATLSHTLK